MEALIVIIAVIILLYVIVCCYWIPPNLIWQHLRNNLTKDSSLSTDDSIKREEEDKSIIPLLASKLNDKGLIEKHLTNSDNNHKIIAFSMLNELIEKWDFEEIEEMCHMTIEYFLDKKYSQRNADECITLRDSLNNINQKMKFYGLTRSEYDVYINLCKDVEKLLFSAPIKWHISTDDLFTVENTSYKENPSDNDTYIGLNSEFLTENDNMYSSFIEKINELYENVAKKLEEKIDDRINELELDVEFSSTKLVKHLGKEIYGENSRISTENMTEEEKNILSALSELALTNFDPTSNPYNVFGLMNQNIARRTIIDIEQAQELADKADELKITSINGKTPQEVAEQIIHDSLNYANNSVNTIVRKHPTQDVADQLLFLSRYAQEL